MADYSPLTDSYAVLKQAAIQTLTDEGYTYNPLTTSFNQYLATALTGIGGSTVSHLRMSMPQLLAGLVNELGGGPVSHLTSTIGELLALLGTSGESPDLPTAPVLDMDPLWDETQSTPLWVIDAAWEDQDDLQFEVQADGGDWSGATVTNHTVTTSEIDGTQIDFPSDALSNGDYEARCKFKHSGGSYSAYSNIVSFTINADAIDGRLLWGADQLTWGADRLIWS